MQQPLVGSIASIGEIGPGQTATPAAAVAPRPGWPAKTTLDYHKTLIELLLLILGVPWILKQLFNHPGKASHQAAATHLKGA